MNEREIFQEALDHADSAQRQAYLDHACGGDAALRARIEALLSSHASESQFLNVPALKQLQPPASINEITVAVHSNPGGDAAADEKKPNEKSDDLHFLQPSTRPDSLGRIGHYEVLQVLGRGGFGIVFRAYDEVLLRVVALKVLAPAIAATSPARKRFLREARSSAQVRHEHVVQVYAVEEQPIPYLVMEFIPGETLQQRLDRTGPLDVPEILRIGRQIAEGLAAAHATGLIHRDIKPGNILLEGGHQRVKITDFGLARAADDASLTQSGVLAGTPMYMAPEQAKGEKIDYRADLFSLGSVLYVMASGRPPFRASNTFAVLKRVVDDDPRPIREVIPEMPQWLCDIITKLHAKKPEDRFQSAREVTDILADCEAQLKAGAKLKGFSRIPQNKAAAGRSGRWKWVAAAALFLIVLALWLTERTEVMHWFRSGVPTANPTKAGSGPSPTLAARNDPPAQVQGAAPPLAVAPFNAAQAKEHQVAWAKHFGNQVEITNSIGMKLRLIPPAGKFSMLSDNSINNPPRRVSLPRQFYLGIHEVTVGQFKKFVDETKYKTDAEAKGNAEYWDFNFRNTVLKPSLHWRNPPFPQSDVHPVCCVSWNDAQRFCEWLSRKESRSYQLPSNAEWEYACRAGAPTNGLPNMMEANLANPKGTVKVGSYSANAFGLFDMIGNVYEWCEDVPAKGDQRVRRGGGYSTSYTANAFFSKGNLSANTANASVGFRVAIVDDLKAKDKPPP